MKARLMRSWGLATALVAALAAAPVTFGPETSRASRTRPAALAGSWYPDGRASLVAAAHFLMRLAATAPTPAGKPFLYVVPHAGWSYSGVAAATAFRLLKPGDFERVVVVAPSHQGAFRGYALDDATAYRTPIGDVPLCDGAFAALQGAEARVVPGVTEGEHSVEIELPFLQASLGRFCLVPALAGDTDETLQRAFAERLAKLDDGRTLFVFSSDFAHYGPRYDYQPFGPLSPAVREKIRAMDDRGADLLARKDARGFRAYLVETGSTICGRHGLATMLELLPRIAPKAVAVPLAHYASSDIPGLQDDSSVSYVAIAFLREAPSGASPGTPLVALPRLEDAPPGTPSLTPEEGARLVRLARAALETHFFEKGDLGRQLAAWPKGPDRERKQGVFVTLNRTDPVEVQAQGRLRGCIGQPEPQFPLYYGTVQAALDAALRDPRFEPLAAAELTRIEVEVTVLSPRTPVASWRDIRLGTHGIVLQKGEKAALFLPQVAPEQHWTLEQTLTALSEKAGLPPDGWKDGTRFSVFTGQVFEERK
ncbi:MAG TPA: AmmeMemoRadiSam system protein B [Vicinamibacteria bacterium]|nr:AmmeMemoRadiSam system protein B [Vicinamibacteria bacterium]